MLTAVQNATLNLFKKWASQRIKKENEFLCVLYANQRNENFSFKNVHTRAARNVLKSNQLVRFVRHFKLVTSV